MLALIRHSLTVTSTFSAQKTQRFCKEFILTCTKTKWHEAVNRIRGEDRNAKFIKLNFRKKHKEIS